VFFIGKFNPLGAIIKNVNGSAFCVVDGTKLLDMLRTRRDVYRESFLMKLLLFSIRFSIENLKELTKKCHQKSIIFNRFIFNLKTETQISMFKHKHPYSPFIPTNATKLIVGTLPPPRFSIGNLKKGDVDFCYGSIDGLLWRILSEIFNLDLHFETTQLAIQQRKNFLIKKNIGICDIVASCERKKMDASDLGMENIQLRNMLHFIKLHPKVKTLLLTGGNSKNGPEYHLRRYLKEQDIALTPISTSTPRIHSFTINDYRIIKVVSLTAPTGTANRAVGSNPEYKILKKEAPKFTTFDFRVLQYKKFF